MFKLKLKPKTCKAVYVEDNTKCGRLCKGKLYCKKHKCQMDKCEELNDNDSNCCPKHQCQYVYQEEKWSNGSGEGGGVKCKKCVIKGKKVCVTHKCKEEDCIGHVNCHYVILKLSETSGRKEIVCHKFCIAHECKEKDCQKRKIDGFDYCEDHKCREDGCGKEATLNYYCSYHHRCQYEGCEKQCPGNFCKFHTCSKCANRIEINKTMCTNCIIDKAM